MSMMTRTRIRRETNQTYRVTMTEVRVYTMEIGSHWDDEDGVEAWARDGWEQSGLDTSDLDLADRRLLRVVALPVGPRHPRT